MLLRTSLLFLTLSAGMYAARPAPAPKMVPPPSLTSIDPAIVALPEFQVFANRELPAQENWSYTKIGHIEFLSNESERATKRFIREFQEFQNVLEVVSPQFVIRSELPLTVILCGRNNQFDRFAGKNAVQVRRGIAAALLKDHEIATIAVNLEQRTAGTWFFGMFGDDDPEPVYHQQEFQREYIHLVLSRMEPRPPAWLAEGLAQIYSTIDYTNDWIEFGKKGNFLVPSYVDMPVGGGFGMSPGAMGIPGMRDASMDGDYFSYGHGGFGSFGSGRYRDDLGFGGFGGSSYNFGYDYSPRFVRRAIPAWIMPFKRMFAVDYTSKEFQGAATAIDNYASTWPRQVATFVHMALYGEQGKFREGFLKFAARATKEPVTEAMFKECLGMSFREAGLELRAYTETGRHSYMVYRAKKGQGFVKLPEVTVRPATDAEIGRIKGEAFRLSGQDDEAQGEFVRSYLRGERDPHLLASLGLMARQRGDTARARTYLEAVAKAPQVIRPRAYLELTRLRAQALTGTQANRPFTADETGLLLTPLFAARKLPLRIPDVYGEIARVWERSGTTPSRQHLAVLDEGVSLFPFNTDVIYRSAVLLNRHGYKGDAAARAEHGLKVARDPETKSKFEALKKEIGESRPTRTAPAPGGGAASL